MVTAPVRLSSIWACGAILLWLALPAFAAPTRKVSISTEPKGAIVYIGEKEAGPQGVTPVVLNLPVGDNVVIIELENFVPKFETLTVPKGKGKPIKVTYKLDRGNGALVVVTDAAGKGAKVMVDDEDRGTAPARIDVPAGTHRVELIVKGKTIYSDEVDVGAGGETNVVAKAAGKLGKDAAKEPKDGGKDGKVAAKGKGGKGDPPPDDPVAEDPPSSRERLPDPVTSEEPRQADPPVISTREDGPEPVLREKVRTEPKRDKPSGPRRLRIAPLVESGYRYLDYSAINSGANLPALRQRGTVLFGARVEFQPLRSLAGLMIAADGGYGIPQTLTTSRGSAQSVWWRGEAEVSYRLGLGPHWGIFALVGYSLQRFKFDGEGSAEALVPAATYNLIRLGAGAGYRQGAFEVLAQVENRPVLTGGTFSDRFQTASADGLAARLTAIAHLGSRFFARLEGNYARYAWSFGYDQDDLYRAGGATDLMFGVTFATGAAF